MLADLHLSPLTLGTVQLGMTYGIANKSGMPDETTAFEILREALEGGVTSWDTAHAYGHSERILGRFFENRPKQTIVSKLRIEGEGSWSPLEVEKQIIDQTERILTDLKIDRLPALLLHNPDQLVRYGKTVTETFKRLCKEGYTDYTGVSFGANTDEQFRTIWETVSDDVYQVVQIPINVLDHRLIHNGGLNRLQESGKVVFARSIFMQGLLFLQDHELPPHLRLAAEPLSIVRDIAAKAGMTIEQLAISFVRDLEAVDSLVIGMETVEQLRIALAQITGPPLTESIRAECVERLRMVPEQVVNTLMWNP